MCLLLLLAAPLAGAGCDAEDGGDASGGARQVLLVAITGDRGLCGGYNTYAIKKVEARAAELKEQGIDFDMICIGNKGNTVCLYECIIDH